VEYATAVNIGPNPTFRTMRSKVECHLLDFDGDLYDTRISIGFVDRIRSVRKFNSAAELRARIAQDVDACRKVVTDYRTISPI
jgi:riboflavin kinase/FMN adenylyltransferase